MSGLGFRPGEVDLRSYFGDAALLRRDLAQYDALWVRGGNVFVLRYALHHSGGDAIAADPLAAGALVYAGYSAGRAGSHRDDPAAVAATYGAKPIWEGLGLLDYSIVPRRFTASALAGISLCAWWRTMSGTSSLPMPCPSKLTAMVSRELVSVRGSTVTSTVADGSVDALHAPCPGCVDVGELGGDGPVGSADAPGGQALRAHLRGAGLTEVTVDDALLPFVEACGAGGVGEHLCCGPVHHGAGDGRCRVSGPRAGRRSGPGRAAIPGRRRRRR